ncbi:MAG TPA: hypothetical protein VJT72_05585 [Pseudonocardiaceae bacterium]|nr:hypothetical protein [Pseudonocardiaceae bacterium]
MKRVVFYSAGPDIGGCGIALKRAFDKYAPDWEARAICRQKVYLDYETDLFWPLGYHTHQRREVIRLLRDADVLHVMDNERGLQASAPYLRGKTLVLHHLGSHFRNHERAVSQVARRYGAIEVTDSVDLIRPHVGFMPVPADFTALAKLRKEQYRPSHRVRIAHAPTHRPIKSTQHIIQAVEELSKRYPIDFDLIERVGNRECLERKARADIFVDQLLLGFGVNVIESWAMGIPVVSGWGDPEHEGRSLELFGQLPWASATPQTLVSVLEHLVTSPEWRAELGARGHRHGMEWHSEPAVVRRTIDLYESAQEQAA